MYNPNILFGGISILIIGDFFQIPVTTGCDLWSVMYGTVNGNNATMQNLFQQFHGHELTGNVQAADCVIHMQRVAAFCALSLVYPTGQKWSAKDNAHYKPITRDIVDGVTHKLASQYIEQDPNCITHSTCIVTSNDDRAIINAAAAEAFGKQKNVPVLWWKRQLHEDFPLSSQAIFYNEDKRPELFAYFVQGGPGQVLNNAHGNVYFGVANGTPCTMHSLAQDDPEEERVAFQAIAKSTPGQMIDLPTPPDCIIIDVKPQAGMQWPKHLDLAPGSNFIRIMIGLTSRCNKKAKVGIQESVAYYAHAVDLAFAITVWKCQGGTFEYIIALLEHSPGSPALTFEKLYMMFT
jgi:hypothetical protein